MTRAAMPTTIIGIIAALALGGCADAAFRLGALAIDAVGACLNGEICSSRSSEPARPDCPPGVDSATVTWCRVVTPR
jgi:hypothetical protein